MRTFVYWLTTLLVSLGLGVIGYMTFGQHPMIVAPLDKIGVKGDMLTVLGFWKMLVPPVLLLPGFGRLKDWCYAGIFFTLTGAALLHWFADDGKMMGPLSILGLSLVSYALRPASRCVGGAIVPEFG